MENKKGITLNLDIVNFQHANGDVDDIKYGADEEYVTKVAMVLPVDHNEKVAGDYQVEFNQKFIDISLKVISNANNDPIMMFGQGLSIGTPGMSVPELHFSFFTDNRGKYPCVLAIITFPYRLANWMDPNDEFGFKIDHGEEVQIIGPPLFQDKVVALTVLNRLFRSAEFEKVFNPLTYDDVTVFIETYLRQHSNDPLLTILTALTSKTAYREAVEEHFLAGFWNREVKESVERLALSVRDKEIKDEADLLEIVAAALSDILAHHVENRRWLDAFWDGERKIMYGGEEITLPRWPKSETEIQPTLHVVLEIALSPLGIQVIRESNEGVGNLDFRFLYTTKTNQGISVGTEFKLAHHKELRKGIRSQLPAYLKAIRSSSGIFTVIWFKDRDGKFFKEPPREKEQTIEWLRNEAQEVSDKENITVIAALIDASIKTSASKIK